MRYANLIRALVTSSALVALVASAQDDEPVPTEAEAVTLCEAGELHWCAVLAELYYYELDRPAAARFAPRACSDTFVEGCGLHARLLASGDYGTVDLAQALEVVERGCDAEEAGSCYHWAVLLETEPALFEQNPGNQRAIELLDKACDLGFVEGCSELGALYYSGRGGAARNMAQASAAYRRACDLGDNVACIQAQRVLE